MRSQTVVVANTRIPAPKILHFLEQKGFEVGSGYQQYKDSQIRIANFPAMDMEQTQELAELLVQLPIE